jgi:hypothetical protein
MFFSKYLFLVEDYSRLSERSWLNIAIDLSSNAKNKFLKVNSNECW